VLKVSYIALRSFLSYLLSHGDLKNTMLAEILLNYDLNMKTILFLFNFLFCISSLHSQQHSVQDLPWSNGKIVLSDNRHFLEYENGRPFFWLAETGWKLFQKLSREEVIQYLENRRAKGFNVIQCVVVHSISEVNYYGDSAFVFNDPAKINTTAGKDFTDAKQYDYWDHIEYVVDEAARYGLYLAMVPVWGEVVKQGFFDPDIAERYAWFLAERFKAKPNIFWINGGDIKGDVQKNSWETIGLTLKKYNPDRLITFHPFGRTQSSTWFQSSEWLDFNMFQSGHRRYDQDNSENKFGEDNWRYVLNDYAKTPVKPTLDGEPSYENIPQGLHDTTQPYWNANDVRRYAYWSVFAGACGHTYGNNSVMQMYRHEDAKPAYGARKYWYEALDDSGACQMKFVKELVLSRSCFERVFDDSAIAGDVGKKYDFIAVARGRDYLMAYTYTGRTFSLKMGKITGTETRAWWYNPRNGEASEIGIVKNNGVVQFDPPGEKADGNDWVLVLDDIASSYTKPGIVIDK
jgi:hypothetical protein